MVKTTTLLLLTVFACLALFIETVSAQESVTFIIQGSVSDGQGFTTSESFLLPLTNSEHIAQARAILAKDSNVPGWEDQAFSATIEVCDNGSNRNYSLPGRPAWSWCINEFIEFHSGIHPAVLNPIWDDSPSRVDEDPAGWIAQNGNRIAFSGFLLVAELSNEGKTEFINISTRGFVGVGEQVLIAGLIIPQGATKTVLFRGIGPSLADHDVQDPLLDPKIILYKGPDIIAQNDNWQEGQSMKPFDYVPARLLPTRDQEAAFLITLEPGLYTIHLVSASKSQTSGIGLIEAYDMDDKLD